jgi:hypothetical protein
MTPHLSRRLGALALLWCSAFTLLSAQQQGTWNAFEVRYWNTNTTPSADRQAALRASEPWQRFLAERGNWYVEFDEISGLPRRASGPAFALMGSSPEQKADYLWSEVLGAFPVPFEHLSIYRSQAHGRFQHVDYFQRCEGLRIIGSRATVRLTQDGRVVLFGAELFPDARVNPSPALSAEAAGAAIAQGVPAELLELEVSPELAVLPYPGARGLEYRLVYQVEGHFGSINGVPGLLEGYVDAHSGELLSRRSRVHDCANAHGAALSGDVEALGTVTDNPLVATEVRGLPYLRVVVDGQTFYTDTNGELNLPDLAGPTPATAYMDGRYARVLIGASGSSSASLSTTLVPGPNVINLDDEATTRQISAYYHTNRIWEFVKSFFPGFTTLDFPFTVRVDRTDGSCNAFYDGSSINFYADGGGCRATALFSDVVYHEYGHGLNYDVYQFFGDFSGMTNGAMQEGYADIWGLSITGNPVLASGFTGPSSSFIRRYDIDPKVYPEDLVGQVHNDGEIIAGAWWDFGVLRGSLTEMTDLWLATFPAALDGPDGTEGTIYRNVLVEALVQDDDDGDISNGTPRSDAIIQAFGIHGITLLANADLDHTPTATTADQPLVIEAELEVDFPAYLGDLSLVYREQGGTSWNTLVMGTAVEGTISATLPAYPAGTILEYYFTLKDIYEVQALTKPARADEPSDPNLPYFHLVEFARRERQDFDNFAGDWVFDPFGTDNATSGRWEMERPQRSSTTGGFVNQPDFDNTPDNTLQFCLVTEATGYSSGSGANYDIDGGETSVRSKPYNAADLVDPVLSYYRWFSNDPPGGANPGNDPFEVFISNDGSSWTRIRNTFTSDASWRRDIIRISDYVVPTETVYLLFMASDRILTGQPLDGGSLVEALVDDVDLYERGLEEGPTSGLETLQAAAWELFPNPASGAFQVSLPDGFVPEAMELISSSGQRVWSANPDAGASVVLVPDMGLAEGLYLLRVLRDGAWSQRSVVLQR